MSGVEKISNLVPASFDDRRVINVTDGQREIIKMLKTFLSEGRVITREDILECYIRSNYPSGFVSVHRFGDHNKDGNWHDKLVTLNARTTWEVKTRAVTWFKNNLGSCILKGKILAIPAIEAN